MNKIKISCDCKLSKKHGGTLFFWAMNVVFYVVSYL
jgi:hypothetical protein